MAVTILTTTPIVIGTGLTVPFAVPGTLTKSSKLITRAA